MLLSFLDWIIIGLFLALFIAIGIYTHFKNKEESKDYFLAGRNMPWWLLGISMVATTFSADTPNLVTDIVRTNGVAGNWAWWVFCLTGMLTVFVYAKLWRRSGVFTDIEFYELRYGGRKAGFLRGFRAIYLGVFFNVVVMATVCLAAIKIGGVLLGLSPVKTVLIAGAITVLYSSIGGLRGVIYTDVIQFVIAMVGSIAATIYIINMNEVGSLQNLFEHPQVIDKIAFFPSIENKELWISLLIIPLAVQWWSVWYPGAEPGGGGYIAQRMLSAKDEKNATGATFLFNIAHYAIRPWPWILVALASLIFFPTLDSIREAFPMMAEDKIGHDLAYPAMLSYLPSGLIGLVMVSLIAAFMSTLSTHLNWGASYITLDVYKRFVRTNASEKELVMIGRISTVVLMILAAILALKGTNALQFFNILLQIGAGTGLIFILRWFWWRINAWTEITAMFVSFGFALINQFGFPHLGIELQNHESLVLGVAITSVLSLLVAFATKPEDDNVLVSFYQRIKPANRGWKTVLKRNNIEASTTTKMPLQIEAMLLSVGLVYGFLLGTGSLLYGNYLAVLASAIVVILFGLRIRKIWLGDLFDDKGT